MRCKTRTRWIETRCMTEVEQSQRHGRRGALVAPCYVWSHFYYPLLIVNLLIYSIKMICTFFSRTVHRHNHNYFPQCILFEN